MAADMKRIVEALLFASPEPLSLSRLKSIVPRSDKRKLRVALDELRGDYDEAGHAFQLCEIGGGWRIVTRPEYSKKIEEMLKGQRRVRLSKPALECLSVIAYRQPATRIDVEKVRGVNCGGSMSTLLERGLIRISGRAETLGRPLLYGTSDAFLAYLGINSIEDLPQMVEIESLLTSGQGEEEGATVAPEERRERLYASMETIAEVIAEAQPPDGDGDGNGNGNGKSAAESLAPRETQEELVEAAAAELATEAVPEVGAESGDSLESAQILEFAPIAGRIEPESEPEAEIPSEHEEILREELAVERASLQRGPQLVGDEVLEDPAAGEHDLVAELAEPQDEPEP